MQFVQQHQPDENVKLEGANRRVEMSARLLDPLR